MHIGRRPHAWPRWASASPFVQVQEFPSSTDLTDQGGGDGRTPLYRRRLQTHPPPSLTPGSRRACPSLRRPSSLCLRKENRPGLPPDRQCPDQGLRSRNKVCCRRIHEDLTPSSH
ncbi:hypothetical protein ACQJBY_065753 [Aegilops geniculata]